MIGTSILVAVVDPHFLLNSYSNDAKEMAVFPKEGRMEVALLKCLEQ